MGFFNKKLKKDDVKKKEPEAKKVKQEEKPSETVKKELQDSKVLPILGEAIVQPRVSEKSGSLAKLNKYIFVVKKSTNKVEVKKTIEKTYKVKVTGVNIVNVLGKIKRKGRITGKTGDFKKAVVTLKQGDRIEGVIETA